jgi:hypothetical protein
MMRGFDPEPLCSDRMVLSGDCLFSSLRRDTRRSTLTLEFVEDYRSQGPNPRQHLLVCLRAKMREHLIRSCPDLHRLRDGQCVTLAGLVLVREQPRRGAEASAIRCATRDFRWGSRTCKDVRHARTRPQTTDETAQDRNAAVPLHRLRRSPSCHLLRSPDTRGIELVRLAPEARLRPAATRQNSA